MSMEAISGRVRGYKTMADGKPRIIIDLDCELTDAAGLLPVGAEVGLARLSHQPMPVEERQQPVLKGGELAKLAGRLCDNKYFLTFLWEVKHKMAQDSNDAAECIRLICGINSRVELDHNEKAAKVFHDQIRKPFNIWYNKKAINSAEHQEW